MPTRARRRNSRRCTFRPSRGCGGPSWSTCRARKADERPVKTRPVYFGETGGMADAKVYERTALAPGFKGQGPALIEEYGSTTLIWPGDGFEVGKLGEIRVTVAGER